MHEAGYKFTVMPANCPEESQADDPEVYVECLAKNKAKNVFERTNVLSLGADTIVVLDGVILEKPANKPENAEFLRRLSNRSHYVYTGYAIIGKDVNISGIVKTEVVFNDLSEDLINDYVNKGLGLDKAGGYGIQNGYPLVKEYIGSFTNVMGLPIETIDKLLKEVL